MAEGLAGISLACNIIQLIEFRCKILVDSREVHKSSTGLASRHVALENIAKRPKDLSDNVAAQPNASSRLISLAAESKRLVQELLDAVDKLKAKASDKKWDSFKIELKTVLKEKDFKEIHESLVNVQTQLGQHLQESVFAGQTSLSLSLKGLEQELDKVRHSTAEIRSLTQGMADALQKLDIGLSDGKRVLESLYFPQIPKRLSGVPHAHQQTFTWVFDTDHSESPFARWASGDTTQTFWIQGKPGSGKSTLMKLICGHEKTKRALETWGAGSRIIVSSYFFWNAGNKRQKSLEGLLRALLFEVMTQCPDVIEVACGKADRVSSLPPSADPWPMTDLLPALEKMLNALEAASCKLRLFIDGLDEFDGQPDALIDILDSLSNRSNLKLCVSSRPWTSFRDRYGDDPTHHLNLEDLTENDI
ncbi:hypothetical protein INS49_014789 [Diaporthe citri]|uniref:uncharacterized protein n=1 Tax=Diaporthe citri TaxID=83186 RepID=UPI001C81D8E3|nr:uncharacterized protein INS49_014789 [Diaporthe citri]KAG6356914.1 hypothetical protein INS49_014789 [Diaporthe citri]